MRAALFASVLSLCSSGTAVPVAQSKYSAVVAFGASYTDNAHARPEQYSGSIRNYYPYNSAAGGGRYSNGPVAVEYLTNSLRASLFDYAYGGSQIDNSLTSGSVPASGDQIKEYLSDVAVGKLTLGSKRVLHYINTGINPVAQIWSEAMANSNQQTALASAHIRVTQNAQAVASQFRSIAARKIPKADYLIVSIPPLETIPTFIYQASGDANALAILKQLSDSYSAQLKAFSRTFEAEVKSSGGTVLFYDLKALWNNFAKNPSSYGITVRPATTTCYDSSTGGVCGNPGTYWYFDSLHPVTSIHQIWAKKMATLVGS